MPPSLDFGRGQPHIVIYENNNNNNKENEIAYVHLTVNTTADKSCCWLMQSSWVSDCRISWFLQPPVVYRQMKAFIVQTLWSRIKISHITYPIPHFLSMNFYDWLAENSQIPMSDRVRGTNTHTNKTHGTIFTKTNNTLLLYFNIHLCNRKNHSKIN